MSKGEIIMRRTSRREAVKSIAAAGAGILAAPFLNKGRYLLFAGSPAEYSSRAIELVGRTTVIDMLSPFAISPSRTMQLFGHPETFTSSDLEQFRSSGIRLFHIGIGNGGPDAYTESLQFFGLWNGFIAHHGQNLMRVDSPASFEELKKSAKIGVLLGLQNSDHFRRPDDVDLFFSLGQRVSQLTYNARNLIGNGSTERRDDGISDFGIAIVGRMNKLGMVVEVDEPTTIEDALNHFDHVAKLVGVEHVGVGSDSDLQGYDRMPPKENEQLRAGYKGSYAFREKIDIEGLNHPKRMFDLAEGLIRRKYNDSDIELILGGNFKRVLTAIWTI